MSEKRMLRSMVATGIFTASFTAASHAVVVLQEGFETYTGATNVSDTGDFDPGSPAIGGGAWTVNETTAARVQVYDSPVTGAAFDASGSDKFLHLTRDGDQAHAWAPIAAYDSGANTQMVITARMYNAVGATGGRTGFAAFNSAPNVYTGRLFDLSFRENGEVWIYNANDNPHIANAYNLNAWNDVRIELDFVTDTYNLLINNVPITTNQTWEGGNLSTFQHLYIDNSEGSSPANVGWDDITVTAVPEPASLGLLAVSAIFATRRRRA